MRAYALIEVEPGATDVVSSIRSFSLQNCLLIAERLYPSEVIAHIEGTELADLNRAVTDLMSGIPAILRITVLRITTER